VVCNGRVRPRIAAFLPRLPRSPGGHCCTITTFAALVHERACVLGMCGAFCMRFAETRNPGLSRRDYFPESCDARHVICGDPDLLGEARCPLNVWGPFGVYAVGMLSDGHVGMLF